MPFKSFKKKEIHDPAKTRETSFGEILLMQFERDGIFSRVLRESMNRYVDWSVSRAVSRSPLAFFGVFGRLLYYCSSF